MAQANLGVMYELGHGVPQDLVKAHMWFALSAAGFPASEAKNRGIATRKPRRDRGADDCGPARAGAKARTRVASALKGCAVRPVRRFS
jgi:TPR repeat protein